jgi:hypothetical protein
MQYRKICKPFIPTFPEKITVFSAVSTVSAVFFKNFSKTA